MMLQVAVAGVVGVVAFFRGTIVRAFQWFKPRQNLAKDRGNSDDRK
jgi:hypothetical protein